MTEKIHSRRDVIDAYAQRGIDNQFPQLKPYLFAGARVLDVGCGPGTITMDVAQLVHPGEVYGIDPVEVSIAQANEIKAERRIPNVTFRVADARALSFPDHEFDVVYAHAVFGWFPEPIKALVEMRRVTKEGGSVVITLPEEGSLQMYPPCPAYEKVRAILRKYWTDPADPDHYYDNQLGRRVLELLKEAGFGSVSIEALPIAVPAGEPSGGLYFAGREPFNISYYLLFLDYERVRDLYQKIFSLGVLDEQTVIQAQNEVKNWASHPYASLVPMMKVIAAGQA